jgi:hypothetical protein
MIADELITKILDVASDYEADRLDDLLVRCGYWWECPEGHGYFKVTDSCDVCGAARTCTRCQKPVTGRYHLGRDDSVFHPECWDERAR